MRRRHVVASTLNWRYFQVVCLLGSIYSTVMSEVKLTPYIHMFNCFQNFHLWRYIVGYTLGNLVLQLCTSEAVKRDFWTYIQRYISPNENSEYGYHRSIALLQFGLILERCKLHNAARHAMKCDVTIDVKLFPTVYRRINCRKFLTLSNQKSRYKSKCIRIIYFS